MNDVNLVLIELCLWGTWDTLEFWDIFVCSVDKENCTDPKDQCTVDKDNISCPYYIYCFFDIFIYKT